MATDRQVKEGKQIQGVDEQIPYSITTTPWGSSPSGVTVAGYDVTAGIYTLRSTGILASSTATISGDKITLPKVQNLTAGQTYKIEVKFTAGGALFEPYILIEAER